MEQTRSELDRIGSEMREIKERLDTLTASLDENKDEGQSQKVLINVNIIYQLLAELLNAYWSRAGVSIH